MHVFHTLQYRVAWHQASQIVVDSIITQEDKDALVKVMPTADVIGKINFHSNLNLNSSEVGIFYCNFHYRRTYYRFVSNGIVFEDFNKVIDERSRMTMTIAEEADRLTYI